MKVMNGTCKTKNARPGETALVAGDGDEAAARSSGAPELLPEYLAKIGKGSLRTHRQEVDLASKARSGDGRARKRERDGAGRGGFPAGPYDLVLYREEHE